jgi:hypothetical protein
MPRRVLAAGLVAVLALPALAQAPVTPIPADRQPGGEDAAWHGVAPGRVLPGPNAGRAGLVAGA